MQPWLWLALVPVCGVAAFFLIRRPIRDFREARVAVRARAEFRLRREHLEMDFLNALECNDPVDRVRWEGADWLDEVIWAREKHSRRLLALVGARFDPSGIGGDPHDFATTIFEFQDGRWQTQGYYLDAIRPSEAFQRHRQLEPIELPQQPG